LASPSGSPRPTARATTDAPDESIAVAAIPAWTWLPAKATRTLLSATARVAASAALDVDGGRLGWGHAAVPKADDYIPTTPSVPTISALPPVAAAATITTVPAVAASGTSAVGWITVSTFSPGSARASIASILSSASTPS